MVIIFFNFTLYLGKSRQMNVIKTFFRFPPTSEALPRYQREEMIILNDNIKFSRVGVEPPTFRPQLINFIY